MKTTPIPIQNERSNSEPSVIPDNNNPLLREAIIDNANNITTPITTQNHIKYYLQLGNVKF